MSFVILPALAEIGITGLAADIIAFGIQMVASSIISKIFAPDTPNQSNLNAQQPNPGNRQQIPPAGDNKIPVVYGSAYVGGIITDLTISDDNQDIYWVFALSEVTNTETGGTPDTFTFGNVYWGGKRCIFDGTDLTKVTGLYDESTGETQDISGYMNIYLYKNGSNQPSNSSQTAISVLSASNLIYKWNSSKLMSNCAFAIIHLKYNSDRNLTGLNQTRFQLTNSRHAPGDCFLDYLSSTRYGAAIPVANIDSGSLATLNIYSNASFTYTNYSGGTSTQPRFTFNGTLDTNLKIMQNIQNLADCCDCLVKYNEITGLWGVITQTPTYTVAMDINNSNMIGAITVSPIDLNNSFNIIEAKFPDGTAKDSFNSASFDLAVINPSLLFANEPVNKQSVNLYLVNNSVQAQYLANRMLEAAREDLQIQVDINYIGLELEAGDIVTVTNANYGWTAKLFRISKVIEKFSDDGKVFATLYLMEYNPAVYDDKNITEFTPSPNTGIGSPITFGTIPVPVIVNPYPSITNPAFSVRVTTSSAGITQYAEVWYSAYQYPTPSQLIFAGTTEIQSNGNPYTINYTMPDVQLFNIPAGDWYFFSRMVNSIASSDYSLASTKFVWRPTTFQYSSRYLAVAYADDITGATNFSFNPANRLYYGLANQDSTTAPSSASSYKWYLADPAFGTNKYLAYTNRTGRKFSFDTDFAGYAAGTAAFVPTTTSQFDFRIWSALPNGTNIIDLDQATGQIIKTGTTTTGTGQVKIVNTIDGQVVAALDQFLDFGGPTTFTTTPSSITVDIYGRVVGFSLPDNFYMTIDDFVATSGQTVFSVTRAGSYIVGQCLVFQNGLLLDQADFTDASSSVTLTTGATLNDNITIISMRAISSNNYYDNTHLNVLTVAGAVVTWNGANMPYQIINVGDIMTFTTSGSPTQYTVSSVNYSTQQITFTTTVTGVVTGTPIYKFRSAGSSYQVFSRYETTLTNASSYEPTDWDFQSGYELPFLNGAVLPDQDYDIVGNTFTHTPNIATGKLTIIQFSGNNLTTPTGTPVNVVTYSVANQTGYAFVFTTGALSVYANGTRLIDNVDYTPATNSYTLTTAYTDSTTILQQQSFARTGSA
ncbi:hypothetical protein EB001_11050 [bacterium]|nr:hypothetical protein [bacterium]